jgi:hypothetical protein
MQSLDQPGFNKQPYDELHLSYIIASKRFPDIPEAVQALVRQLEVIAEQTPITQRMPWPPELLPIAASLQSEPSDQIRFVNPFSFLTHVEAAVIADAPRAKK